VGIGGGQAGLDATRAVGKYDFLDREWGGIIFFVVGVDTDVVVVVRG
jgi:hypothetical protein